MWNKMYSNTDSDINIVCIHVVHQHSIQGRKEGEEAIFPSLVVVLLGLSLKLGIINNRSVNNNISVIFGSPLKVKKLGVKREVSLT